MGRMNGLTIRLAGKTPLERSLPMGKRVEKHIRCSSGGFGQSAHDERSREIDFSLNTSALVRRLHGLW